MDNSRLAESQQQKKTEAFFFGVDPLISWSGADA